MKTALSIAGSDCSGGAGIQADLKTMTLNGVYAMSAVTALTAQNTRGVFGIMESSPEFLVKQIDAVFTDIRPDAVKVGMVSSAGLVEVIAERMEHYEAENLVVDPVMISASGSRLMEPGAVEVLRGRLFPAAALVTPNIPEAEVLSGMKVESRDDMSEAAERICREYGCSVLLKGGHSREGADDLLLGEGVRRWFKGRRIDNPNSHGTGCTLSSAIAAGLAKGKSMEEAVASAKEYVSGALGAMLDLGGGSGPMDHAFDVRSRFV